MLSPCTGQVAHALLTRPPLGCPRIGRSLIGRASPFDLHVLSTPPAFILSQDQTLIFICPFQFNWLYCFLGCIFRPPFQDASDTVLLNFSDSQAPLKSPFLSGIFRVALLFICQGPSGLSPVGDRSPPAFLLFLFFQTQLVYIIMYLSACQQLFKIFFIFYFANLKPILRSAVAYRDRNT